MIEWEEKIGRLGNRISDLSHRVFKRSKTPDKQHLDISLPEKFQHVNHVGIEDAVKNPF